MNLEQLSQMNALAAELGPLHDYRVECDWDGGGEYVTLPFFGHADALAWAHMKHGKREGLSVVVRLA